MRNVSDKSCGENQNTHYTYGQKIFPLSDKVEICGTAREDSAENIKRRMRTACWIVTATDTHPEYVVLIACPM